VTQIRQRRCVDQLLVGGIETFGLGGEPAGVFDDVLQRSGHDVHLTTAVVRVLALRRHAFQALPTLATRRNTHRPTICYTERMARAAQATVNVRLDAETAEALAELTANGAERSEAVRQAIKLARRELRHRRLQEDAERLRNDPDDLAEVRAIQAEMESIRAW
jgi:Arc/MetJ-type ribon-helix-helix transcriptional regulator